MVGNHKPKNRSNQVFLSAEEKRLIEFLRGLGHGRVEVGVEEGQPIISFHVPAEEVRLKQFMQDLGWGQMVLEVKNGLPVMVREHRKDIKLTD